MDTLITDMASKLLTVIDDLTPGDRLRKLREAYGFGIRGVARRSEGAFTHAYVSNLETGVSSWSKASLTTIKGFARAFGITVEELLRRVEGRDSERDTEIPVYDSIGAGEGRDGGEIVEYVDIPSQWRGEFFGYVVEGDSMAPKIPPGSIVIVRKTNEVRPGQTIVCYSPDHGMLLKHVDRIAPDGSLVLVSFNPAFDPIFAKDVYVHGIVYEVRTRYPSPNGTRIRGN